MANRKNTNLEKKKENEAAPHKNKTEQKTVADTTQSICLPAADPNRAGRRDDARRKRADGFNKSNPPSFFQEQKNNCKDRSRVESFSKALKHDDAGDGGNDFGEPTQAAFDALNAALTSDGAGRP